jgi:hypothetical protein
MIVLALALGHLAPAEDIAIVSRIEGRPDFWRDNRVVLARIERGFGIENFDYITTGESSEITLNLLSGAERAPAVGLELGTAIVWAEAQRESAVESETTTEIEAETESGTIVESRAHVRLLSGVAYFDGPATVFRPWSTIEAEDAEFAVYAGQSGETLVVVNHGVVRVRADDGTEHFARPFQAVELDWRSGVTRTRDYGSPLVDGPQWVAETRRLVHATPEAPLLDSLVWYREARSAFRQAYADLMASRDVLDQWADEDRRNDAVGADTTPEEIERMTAIIGRVSVALAGYLFAATVVEHVIDVAPDAPVRVTLETGESGVSLADQLLDESALMDNWVRQSLYAQKLLAQATGQATGME